MICGYPYFRNPPICFSGCLCGAIVGKCDSIGAVRLDASKNQLQRLPDLTSLNENLVDIQLAQNPLLKLPEAEAEFASAMALVGVDKELINHNHSHQQRRILIIDCCAAFHFPGVLRCLEPRPSKHPDNNF